MDWCKVVENYIEGWEKKLSILDTYIEVKGTTLNEVYVFWHSSQSHGISKIALVKLKSLDKHDKLGYFDLQMLEYKLIFSCFVLNQLVGVPHNWH